MLLPFGSDYFHIIFARTPKCENKSKLSVVNVKQALKKHSKVYSGNKDVRNTIRKANDTSKPPAEDRFEPITSRQSQIANIIESGEDLEVKGGIFTSNKLKPVQQSTDIAGIEIAYKVNKNLQNADGSKRFASTNKNNEIDKSNL